MSRKPAPITQSDPEALVRRLSGQPVDLVDVKAQRYVGKFFHRRRLGRKIIAEVEGNHGTYTVSIGVGVKDSTGVCSCYIGARGGCHHVRALAQTFREDPESFSIQETRNREQLRTLDDLGLYLETASLEELLSDLQAHGLPAQRVSRLLGASRRTLKEAVRGERRNDAPDTAGALKLASLYLLEWAEAAARDDDLARALSGRGRRELLDLVGESLEQLTPPVRSRLLARFGPREEPIVEREDLDGGAFLAEIDRFVADCERGVYYDPAAVAAYQESPGGHYEPEIEAFGLLDGFFRRADRYHQAGEHAVAVAAYERLFDLLAGNTKEWFGFGEISGGLETDLRRAMARYLFSLGRICRPEEYVQRARRRVAWTYPALLVTESTPEQLVVLEADLLHELEATEEPAGHMPYSLSLLRQLYEQQGRTEESLALCRRWRHRYPALRAPLMDQAEAAGDWVQLEELAREALSLAEGQARVRWMHDPARARWERRLSRALEQQGELAEAVVHARLAFRSQPSVEAYRWVSGLAARVSSQHRAQAVGDIVDFLRSKLSAAEILPYPGWPSPEATLLARVLLAEGRHSEAYDLARGTKGATQVKLLNLVGNFYLASSEGVERPGRGESRVTPAPSLPGASSRPVARELALSRAAECYRQLVQFHVEARGRDNYAIAATYAAVMREIYLRRGRRGDFDRWYAELMDTHARFRALRDEFRRRLGPEPRTQAASA